MNIPKRGFETAEYENRLGKIQKLMFDAKMDAILLTTQVDIEYYTGFKSQFFQSPTRPWFVLIPSTGKPKAIIPTIGESAVTGLAGFLIACNDSDLKSKLMINENSKILFFGTEGDTDEEMYEQLVGRSSEQVLSAP